MALDGLVAKGIPVPRFSAGVASLVELSPSDAKAHLRELEQAGLEMVWVGEALKHEGFTFAQRLLSGSDHVVVGNGIIRALERVPKSAASAQWTLNQEYSGRYLLGLGASGDTRQRGIGPAPFLRQYLTELDEHTARLTGTSERFPRVLGAYSIGTTTVARDLCDGLLTFLVTAEHTTWARGVMGPEKFLSVGCWAIVDDDHERAYRTARQAFTYYLKLPHQINKFRNLGFEESDWEPPGSDNLIERLVAIGSLEEVASSLQRHFDAGADQVNVVLQNATREQELEYLPALRKALGN